MSQNEKEKNYIETAESIPENFGGVNPEDLADELKLREGSPYHSGLTAVAHKRNRDVCWVCFEPIGSGFVDLPMKEAWIRICKKKKCEKTALAEPMGDYGTSAAIRSAVPK